MSCGWTPASSKLIAPPPPIRPMRLLQKLRHGRRFVLPGLRFGGVSRLLGVIPGRTMAEIVRHVGEPHRRHKISAGREILEWRRVNFHVALGFTAEVCDSVDYTSG